MKKLFYLPLVLMTMGSCNNEKAENKAATNEFDFVVEQFADLRVLRYPVQGFEELELKQKELIYYLSQAAVQGRDILFDQNYRHNLTIRKTLEAIYSSYSGDRNTKAFKHFETYLKRVWFSNGIHHHYSSAKLIPDFTAEDFAMFAQKSDAASFPLKEGETVEKLVEWLTPVMFDPTIDAKRVNQASGVDVILESANNYYGPDVTQAEAEKFYAEMKDPKDKTPISYGLNSTLVKKDGVLSEEVWKIGGKYSETLKHIVHWLKKAEQVAETGEQKLVIQLLIKYYETGDLKSFDKYNVAWLNDQHSQIDFVNGFIESYGDALGLKSSWESIVNFKNIEATRRTQILSNNALWFETNSPVDPRFKKKEVKGVTAKVITVAMLGGDCYPASPLGINLPNADWIRKEHGSKSVTIENIAYSYSQASKGSGFMEEFAYDAAEVKRASEHGFLSGNLHTDMHECLGHGSGQLLPNVAGDELKAYGASIEEARADLYALYYMADAKMVELGLLPNADAYKAEYDGYLRNGLMTQLTRIKLGDNIEQTHMRNRQLIAKWVLEKGASDDVVVKKTKEGKTFFVIQNYERLRELFGELLAEIQRIKSEGDFKAGKQLVETYGVQIDYDLHKEILDRYAKLNLAPYNGFVNPVYKVEKDANGNIASVELDYTEGYTEQMMRYSKENSWE